MFAWLQRLSFQQKIVSLVVFCVFLVSGFNFAIFKYNEFNTKKAVIAEMQNYAEDLGQAIAAQYYERYGDVQAFARNTVLITKNATDISRVFDEYISLYGIYEAIIFVDTQGKLVASNTKGRDGKDLPLEKFKNFDYASQTWFKKSLAGEFTEDKVKNFTGAYFEDFQNDKVVGQFKEKNWSSGFATWVKDPQGKVIGVITSRASSEWVDFEMRKLYDYFSKRDNKNAHISIIDKKGKLVFDHHPKDNNFVNEVINDPEFLDKTNLMDKNDDHAKQAVAGKAGAGWSYNAKLGHNEGFGFSPVESPKFPNFVGWSVLVSVDEMDLLSEIHKTQTLFMISLAMAMLLSAAIGWLISAWMSRLVKNVAESIAGNSTNVMGKSVEFASASTELSEAATEQAAALQETASAVDEINAMVGKNAESAEKGTQSSQMSQDAANKGREAVQKMLESMAQINESSTSLSNQTEENNKKISEIVKVISEIGEKTKVINEIVFQTKLLSFNASVEAARAGEHGKGFAVVAEEVGKLAEMSGSASKEISEMLNASVGQVSTIIDQAQSQFKTLITQSQGKVEEGVRRAEYCDQVLGEIIKNVEETASVTVEIAAASKEQAHGIQEISRAMAQMDQVTQQNSAVAQQSSASAHDLQVQSTELERSVTELMQFITGGKASVASAPSFAPSAKKPKAVVAHNVKPIRDNATIVPSADEFVSIEEEHNSKHKKVA
jgi:methyl-accepting chemotaxis protein